MLSETNSPKNINKLSKGFTLVELVIVLFISSLLFSMGVANYRGFQRRQYLESAVLMLENDLKIARQLALSGRYFTDCTQLHGYMIEVFPDDGDANIYEPDENKYDIGALCDNGERCSNTPLTHCIKRQELPDGIIISNVVGVPGNIVTFLPLGNGIEPNSGDATITLSYPGGGVSDRQITILRTGAIDVD